MGINNAVKIDFFKITGSTSKHDGSYTFPIAYTNAYSAFAMYISDELNDTNDLILKTSSSLTIVVFRGQHSVWHCITIGI